MAIVGDEPGVVALCQNWFLATEHLCSHCCNTADLETLLQKEPFDLLLVDRVLPDSTGHDCPGWRSL